MKVKNHWLPVLGLGMMIFASCAPKDKSGVTGWNYNDEKNGGFEVTDYGEQETGPGLILIEGGVPGAKNGTVIIRGAVKKKNGGKKA